MVRSGRRAAPPSRAPVRPAAPAPAARAPVPAVAPQHAVAPAPMMQSQGPGLFGQMAATAGGVAIGSTVGHVVGHALTGGGSSQPAQAAAPPPVATPVNQQQAQPCDFEMRQFMDCTQQQYDLTMCDGFNQVLKECRTRYRV